MCIPPVNKTPDLCIVEGCENGFGYFGYSPALIYIGIGSNIGNRLDNIKEAISKLKDILRVTKKSSIYETEPVGNENQDWFLNCVIESETDLNPVDLLDGLRKIEKELGRTGRVKWAPRTIDLDILFFGNSIIEEDNLKIPHPELHKRRFVLLPLSLFLLLIWHPHFI